MLKLLKNVKKSWAGTISKINTLSKINVPLVFTLSKINVL